MLNAEEKALEENIPKLEELERLKEQVKFQELDDVEIKDLESNWSNALEPTSGVYQQITNDVTGTYKKINYLIVDRRNNYEVDERLDNKNLNNYTKYFEKAKKYISYKTRIDNINNFLLENIDKEDL